MTLDATTRESNMRASIIKYFVDTIKGNHGIEVIFDKNLIKPDTSSKVLDQWVSVNIGQTSKGSLSEVMLTIYCLQRKDKEGYKLAQLVDKVITYLMVDADTSSVDDIKRIPLYKNFPTRTDWTEIGQFMVQGIIGSQDMLGPDGTKFRILTVTLQWPAKV